MSAAPDKTSRPQVLTADRLPQQTGSEIPGFLLPRNPFYLQQVVGILPLI